MSENVFLIYKFSLRTKAKSDFYFIKEKDFHKFIASTHFERILSEYGINRNDLMVHCKSSCFDLSWLKKQDTKLFYSYSLTICDTNYYADSVMKISILKHTNIINNGKLLIVERDNTLNLRVYVVPCNNLRENVKKVLKTYFFDCSGAYRFPLWKVYNSYNPFNFQAYAFDDVPFEDYVQGKAGRIIMEHNGLHFSFSDYVIIHFDLEVE